jgi:hypothetical protein
MFLRAQFGRYVVLCGAADFLPADGSPD